MSEPSFTINIKVKNFLDWLQIQPPPPSPYNLSNPTNILDFCPNTIVEFNEAEFFLDKSTTKANVLIKLDTSDINIDEYHYVLVFPDWGWFSYRDLSPILITGLGLDSDTEGKNFHRGASVTTSYSINTSLASEKNAGNRAVQFTLRFLIEKMDKSTNKGVDMWPCYIDPKLQVSGQGN